MKYMERRLRAIDNESTVHLLAPTYAEGKESLKYT